jgi:tRNA nucleotidyltransferase (CCA-adding enzyme)
MLRDTNRVTVATRDLRERVRRLPGMARLLPALEGLPPAFLVGGAVRDLLRGAESVDLDIAVEGSAPSTARALAERLGGSAREHERFGTATVLAGRLSFDLAATRRETYERPGALPDVEPASLAEDLGRRDFSINAMAVGLTSDDLGHLYDPHGGLDDLRAGIVRVLHEGSFLDDPTRLLRALRYEARLGFAMDADTEKLARQAIAAGSPATVSGARMGDELMDLLSEPEASAAVRRMRELGLDRALHADLWADPELLASASVVAEIVGADRALAGLAALVSSDPVALAGWVGELGLTASQRDAALRAATSAPLLVRELRAEIAPSRLRELLSPEPPESLALALALGAASDPVLRWVRELSSVRLEIDGGDLLAAGVPEGPAVGRGLEAALRRKLDGEVSGREQELQAALEAARR